MTYGGCLKTVHMADEFAAGFDPWLAPASRDQCDLLAASSGRPKSILMARLVATVPCCYHPHPRD